MILAMIIVIVVIIVIIIFVMNFVIIILAMIIVIVVIVVIIIFTMIIIQTFFFILTNIALKFQKSLMMMYQTWCNWYTMMTSSLTVTVEERFMENMICDDENACKYSDSEIAYRFV